MFAARAFFLALLMCWAFAAAADVAVPPLTARVVDQTATLSSADIAALTQKLGDLEARKGSQIAVLIVPTTQPETIEQFSIRVADAWKIGRRKIDDGAVLVIAKNDRKLRIEVGYGLEGALTDVTSRRIIDEFITPKFRSGDFAGGISAGVDRIIRVVDGEPLPAPVRPAQAPSSGSSGSFDPFNPFLLFALFIGGSILRSLFGRLIGAVATGGIVGLGAWLLAGSLVASIIVAIVAFVFTMFAETFAGGRGFGGSYSGGGSGWNGGGSSSDSGGFSGGGGSFGGGGASGSW